MRTYLDKKRGRRFRIIIEMNAQKQPTHFYEGELITLVDEIIILKDQHLGEVAINPDRIAAIQTLEGPEPPSQYVAQ